MFTGLVEEAFRPLLGEDNNRRWRVANGELKIVSHYKFAIERKLRQQKPSISSLFTIILKLLSFLSPHFVDKKVIYQSLHSMRELSNLPLNHCLVGYHPKNGKRVGDAVWDWKIVKLFRQGRLSTMLNKNTLPAMHGCGLGRIREGIVPSKSRHYAVPKAPIPHWVPPTTPVKPVPPSYKEACAIPSGTVNPFDILGPRFSPIRSGLAQAHLTRPELVSSIAKHLVFLEHVFTRQYKTFRDLPSGMGGQVGKA